MPYGDQAIFLKAEIFHEIGNSGKLPIMEDFELMRPLRRRGRLIVIPVPIITSARRWLQNGVFKTTLMNQIIILAYLLGVPPEQIVARHAGEIISEVTMAIVGKLGLSQKY